MSSAVEKSSDERLILFEKLGVGDSTGGEGIGDVLDYLGASGSADSFRGKSFAV